jgi:hypothetical protein
MHLAKPNHSNSDTYDQLSRLLTSHRDKAVIVRGTEIIGADKRTAIRQAMRVRGLTVRVLQRGDGFEIQVVS